MSLTTFPSFFVEVHSSSLGNTTKDPVWISRFHTSKIDIIQHSSFVIVWISFVNVRKEKNKTRNEIHERWTMNTVFRLVCSQWFGLVVLLSMYLAVEDSGPWWEDNNLHHSSAQRQTLWNVRRFVHVGRRTMRLSGIHGAVGAFP